MTEPTIYCECGMSITPSKVSESATEPGKFYVWRHSAPLRSTTQHAAWPQGAVAASDSGMPG